VREHVAVILFPIPLTCGDPGESLRAEESARHRHCVKKSLEFSHFCKRVCLSAHLGWAWLQGNSRARRRRSAVPALTGFGFPPGLPAAPFEEHKQSAPDPPKNRLAGLESGPLCSGSPQPIGARKEDKHMLCKNRIILIVFSARTPKAALHRTALFIPACRSPQRELERERRQRVQDAHRMASRHQLE
jgi:hypothetical protein